ncbi:MAG: periplasmic heavy metal sensor [Caulobacter sp.]|nr:periplasmic heavy metal sensor [Caulobacter sp.]
MKGRWLLVGLVLSLALNLFLVGLGVGALVFGDGARRGPDAQAVGGPRRAPLWMAGRGLSESHRPAYREVLMRATRETRADLVESRRLKRRAFDAMAATPYDAEAVAADLENARTLEFKARARLEHDVAAFAATLPADERSALSESLRTVMSRPATARLQQTWRPDGRGGPRPEGPPE